MSKYKGYIIKPAKNSPMLFSVATEGQGGKIPAVLEGLFTSEGVAKTAIDEYVSAKERKNGKASSESGN